MRAATRIAKSAFTAAAGFEKLQKSMSMLLGSESLGEKLFGDIRVFAARTPLELEAVAGSVRNLLANAGESSESVIETVRRLGDLALGQGDVLNSLVRAYGQVKSLGKAMTQDLYQFANAGIPIFKALGTVLGVSQAQVRELVSAGKVGFEDVRKALETLTNEGGKFYGQLDAQAELLGGKWSTAMSNVKEAQAALLESFKTEITWVIDGVSQFASAIRDSGDGTRKFLAALTGTIAAIPIAVVGVHSLTFIYTKLLVVMKAVMFNPFGATIAAVGLLSAGLAKIVHDLHEVKQAQNALEQGQRGGWMALALDDQKALRDRHTTLKKQESALARQVQELEKLKGLAERGSTVVPYDALTHQDVMARLHSVRNEVSEIGMLMREGADFARATAMNARGRSAAKSPSGENVQSPVNTAHIALVSKLAGTQRLLNAEYLSESDALKARINARAAYIESLNKEGVVARNNIAIVKELKAELANVSELEKAREAWKAIDAQLFQPRGLDAQKAAIDTQKALYLEAGIDRVSVEKWAQSEIVKIEGATYNKRLQAGFKYAQQVMGMLQQTFSMTQGLVTEIMRSDNMQHQQRIANLDKELERTQTDKEIALANARFYGENEALVLEDFAERERNIKEEKERAELAQKKKAFEVEKGMRIAQVSISMAQGILQAWVAAIPSSGGIAPIAAALAGIMTGIITGLGAAQIGIIASQQFPGLYTGGIVPPQGQAGGLYRLGDKNTAEAVIPLDKLPHYAPTLSMGTPQATQTVNHYNINIEHLFGNEEEAARFYRYCPAGLGVCLIRYAGH